MKQLWYLSLAGPESFFGAVVLEGDFADEGEALEAARALLAEQGVEVPADVDALGDSVPEDEHELYQPHAGRLLSRDDLAALFPGDMVRILTTEADEDGKRVVEVEGKL